jgi:hypothetical protein
MKWNYKCSRDQVPIEEYLKTSKSISSGAQYVILQSQKWMKKILPVPVWLTKTVLPHHNCAGYRGWYEAQQRCAEKSVINMI